MLNYINKSWLYDLMKMSNAPDYYTYVSSLLSKKRYGKKYN